MGKADQSVEDIVMEQNETPKKKKIKKIEETEANELVDYWAARPVSSVSEASPSPLKVKKKKLKKKSAWKISESNQLELNESKNEAIELNTDSEETIKLNRKKKRKAKKLIEMESRNQFCDSLEQSDEVKDIPVMKSKKKKKKNKNTNTNSSDSVNNTAEEKNILFGASDNDWNPTEAVIKSTPSPSGHNFFKKSKSHSAEVKKRKDHISLLDKKKKIVYALSQNRCQSITDMDRSMQDSPDIPFGTEKKPAQGILK